MLGIVLAVFLEQISYLDHWNWLGPVLLVITGMYFIYRHHTHHHFHIDDQMMEQTKTRRQIIYALMAFMFLSPCLEVLAYFINAGMHSWWFLAICIMIYILFSLAGTLIWVYYAYQGIQKINSHAWEHNAGLIMGTIMIITGIVSWLL
jgi:cation transporter-like permease